jgi:sigma-B regulation protein RsbU (phosphoserine phosphatase)
MVNRNITNQSNTNEKTIESLIAELSNLYKLYGEALIMIDDSYKVLDVNTEAEEIFGYDFYEMIGQPLEIITPQAFRKELQDLVQHFFLQELDSHSSRLNYEIVGVKKDGKKFPVLLSLFKVSQLEQHYCLVVVREISKNNLVIDKLSKFTRVVEQTPAIVVITNTDGDIEYVNPAFEKVTGYKIEEVIGKNPRILKSGLVDQSIYKKMWETITTGHIWRGELCNRKKNGEIYWDLGTVSPVLDSQGLVTNYISVKEDITKQKENEMELLAYKEKLEEMVQSKTAELRTEISKHLQTLEILQENVFRLYQAQQIGGLGSWDLDLQTYEVTWSDETYRIFGLSEQEFELSYESAMGMVHPDDRDNVQKSLDTTISRGQDLQIDHRLQMQNGDVKKVTLRAILIKDKVGIPQKLVGTVQDITERSKMESVLLEKERLTKELFIAHDIQMSMLPVKTPIRKGWQFSSFYQAAEQVGGDFYDFINRSSGKVGIIMADVSGKGLPAALFMALSLTAIKTIALKVRTPTNILNQANSLLYKEFNGGDFVTVCYALIDPKTGLLRFSNAGHNHPLRYCAATNTIEEIIVESTALGVIPKIRPGEVSIQLSKGDILIFYTDGLTEAFNCENEVFGKNRLEEVVLANSEKDSEEILNKIVDAWRYFMGEHDQSDDIAIIIVKKENNFPPNFSK